MIDKVYFDLNLISEDNNGLHINCIDFEKAYQEDKIPLNLKKFIKIILFEIQSKNINKTIFLLFNKNFNELLHIIKFTGLLHCFKLIVNNKEIIKSILEKYPDLEVIYKG